MKNLKGPTLADSPDVFAKRQATLDKNKSGVDSLDSQDSPWNAVKSGETGVDPAKGASWLLKYDLEFQEMKEKLPEKVRGNIERIVAGQELKAVTE